jgi:hypothetical protein
MTDDLLIRFRLVGDVARALRAVSACEMRRPHQQARFFIKSELERLGWLEPSQKPGASATNEQTEVKE